MADCANIHLPSENGGSVSCSQFDETMNELRIICNELNALTGGFKEEFLGLAAGDRVTAANPITAVTDVYRNGLLQPSTAYNVTATQVIFLNNVPFGSSPGGVGTEDVVIKYY